MAKQRGRETWKDMALSLGVVVLIIGGVYLLNPPDDPSPVRPADTGDRAAAVASAAQSASWPVLDPTEGLPEDWTLTVARASVPDVAGDGPTTLLLGFVTPEEEYVGVTELDTSAGDLVRDETGGAAEGTVDIAGVDWDVHAAGDGEDDRVLSWSDDGRTVVVRGTGPEDDVRAAAEALVEAEPVPAR